MRVRLWDLDTGRLKTTLDDGQLVDRMAFSPDGRLLACVRGRLAVWDVGSGRVLDWSKAATRCFLQPTFSPDGSILAVRGAPSVLNLLDIADGHVRATLKNVRADAQAFSADGHFLAVADTDLVTVWDRALLRPIVQFEGHVRPRSLEYVRELREGLSLGSSAVNTVWSVTFSPDGRLCGLMRLRRDRASLGRRHRSRATAFRPPAGHTALAGCGRMDLGGRMDCHRAMVEVPKAKPRNDDFHCWYISLGLPDQLWLLGRAEADVRLGIEEQLVPGELQSERDDERRFVEADLGRERVVRGPCSADRHRLLG